MVDYKTMSDDDFLKLAHGYDDFYANLDEELKCEGRGTKYGRLRTLFKSRIEWLLRKISRGHYNLLRATAYFVRCAHNISEAPRPRKNSFCSIS